MKGSTRTIGDNVRERGWPKSTAGKALSSMPGLQRLHLTLLVLGALFFALSANYTALWFDEAYSVGIAAHPFGEIWTIGAADVHPVLYYWMLHCVYLLFGHNVVAFRLVSALGGWLLALLGYTHVRRDFGARCGFAFTLLVFLVPWSVRIALQIRMYSWVALAVMVAVVYGWRIAVRLGRAADKSPSSGPVPLAWWAALALSSLAAAYLHYYGAIAAFCVQCVVLVAVLRNRSQRNRGLRRWFLFAVAAVLAYLPWLFVVVGQAKTVSGGFWIAFEFPGTFAELALFPFNTPETMKLLGHEVGGIGTTEISLALWLLLLGCVVACAYAYGRALPNSVSFEKNGRKLGPVAYCLVVYLGTALVAGIASFVIHQPILFFRYLAAAVGPLLLVMAFVLTRIKQKAIMAVSAVALVVVGAVNYCTLEISAHDPTNDEGLAAYGVVCESAIRANGGGETLAFSDSEGTASIVAECAEGLPIIYTDPAEKYRAFEPRFVIDSAWEQLLDGYRGQAIFIGAEETAAAFADRFGGEVLRSEGYFHPYSSNWLIYSVIEF